MLSVKEAAERAGVHIETVRVWIREGKLPAALPARKKGYQIREKDLEDFLDKKHQVKQQGQVEAEEVLKALAFAWDRTSHSGYKDVAYQVAEMAGLLEELKAKWNEWDGELTVDNGRLLQDRQAYLNTWQDYEKARKIEGELILRGYMF